METLTHADAAQLNRVKERGSGGHVCKPRRTSRLTKVTKGMCAGLSSASAAASLSLQAGEKHSITQEASDNLFVSLRKENTVKHNHSRTLLGRATKG